MYEIKRISKGIILSEPNALNPIRRINELKFKNEDVKESSFIKWRLIKILRRLGYNEINCYNYNFIPAFIPEKTIEFFEKMEKILEKIPFLKEVSGAMLIIAEG